MSSNPNFENLERSITTLIQDDHINFEKLEQYLNVVTSNTKQSSQQSKYLQAKIKCNYQ